MTDIIAEWMAKAEGDFAAGLLLFRRRKSPNYDAVARQVRALARRRLHMRK